MKRKNATEFAIDWLKKNRFNTEGYNACKVVTRDYAAYDVDAWIQKDGSKHVLLTILVGEGHKKIHATLK